MFQEEFKGDRWALGFKRSDGMVDGFSISLGDDALVSILLGMLALDRPSQKAHVLHFYAPGFLPFYPPPLIFLPSFPLSVYMYCAIII